MPKNSRLSFLTGPALLSLAALLVVPASACRKSVQSCEDSTQCAGGFVCSPSGTCEAPADPADAGPPCPETTHFCAEVVPADWLGPVAGTQANRGTALAVCSGAYATEVSVVGEGAFSAGQCVCTCEGDAQGLVCSGATLTDHTSNSCFPSCPVCDAQGITESAGCTALNANLGDTAKLQISLGRVTDSGSCGAPIVSNDFEADFASRERYCSADPVEGNCPGVALCLPKLEEPDYGPMCIYKSGDQACPVEYPAKELRYNGIADDRSCSVCSCAGPAANTSCGGAVSFGTNISCAGILADQGASCIANPVEAGMTAIYLTNLDASCDSSGGELEGAVLLSGETTFCCTEAIADPDPA